MCCNPNLDEGVYQLEVENGSDLLYKMTVDDGGAPCVRDDVLTLAICKPAIRRKAKRGDIILAFAANDVRGWRPRGSYRENRLIYIAQVTTNIPSGMYYSTKQYEERPDCIYEWQGDTLRHRKGAKFHGTAADQRRDVGAASRDSEIALPLKASINSPPLSDNNEWVNYEP